MYIYMCNDYQSFIYRYLYAYEELSKKLGTMHTSSSYFSSRTSLSSRSLLRVRRQSDDKHRSKQTTSISNKRKVFALLIEKTKCTLS